jgi:plastocyanin
MRSMRTIPLALVIGGLALVGCAADDTEELTDPGETEATTSDATDAEPSAEGDGQAVAVQGFRFDPPTLTIAAGDTVTWSNSDGITHTATSGTPEDRDGLFDVEMPEAGTSGTHTFADPGTYPYFCTVHESMTGEIVVE